MSKKQRKIDCESWPHLQPFFADMRRYEAPTRAEEDDLKRRMIDGDESAREELVLRCLRFAVSIAGEYLRHGLPLDDLISEANYGLVEAAQRFDPTVESRFITYCVWRIRQRIQVYIEEQTHATKIPRHAMTAMRKIYAAKADLYRQNQRRHSDEEIAEAAGVPSRYLAWLTPLMRDKLDLDAPISDDPKSPSMVDVLADGSDPTDAATEAADASAKLRAALEKLGPRERAIVTRHWGLDGDEPETLKEIGSGMSVSSSYCQMIEASAFRRLRTERRFRHLRELVA